MTKEQFSDEMMILIDERDNVLFEIERSIFTKRYNLSKKHSDILSIQTIPMIYSIWEGSIQKMFQLYISYLNDLNIEISSFNDGIHSFHMLNTYKQFNNFPTKAHLKSAFFNTLENHYNNTNTELYSIVNTESNVGLKVLNKLLETFGLETFLPRWGSYDHPNKTLKEMLNDFLRYRNGISHGGDISSEEKVTQIIYTKYRKLIIDLMYEIHNRMIDGIEKESYKK